MQPLNDVSQTLQTGWEKPTGIQPRHSVIGMSASQESFISIKYVTVSVTRAIYAVFNISKHT